MDDAGARVEGARNADCKPADMRVTGGLPGALRNRIQHDGGSLTRRRIADHRFAVGDVADRNRGTNAGSPQVDPDQCRRSGGQESSGGGGGHRRQRGRWGIDGHYHAGTDCSWVRDIVLRYDRPLRHRRQSNSGQF